MKSPDQHWIERSRNCLAQGHTGTNSKRHTCYPANYPSHVVRGEGAYVYDAWGNRYLDFVCGLGCLLLGHNHPKVTEAVSKQISRGVSYSLPHILEIEVAEKFQEMFPQIDKVRFLKTGNEATLAAVRIARAASGVPWVYSDGYHGWGDLWTSMTPPADGVVDEFRISRPSGSFDLGTYITEPIALDASGERKAVLGENIGRYKVTVFDEVVTGLRVPKFSVGRWWDLTPHITCFGKAIASGYPLSVVAGKKEVMDCDYFISSTFSGDAVSLAACKATLEEVQRRGTEDLFFYSNRLQNNVNKVLSPLNIKLEGYGTRAQFPADTPNGALVMQEAIKAGILIGKAWFYGYSHMESGTDDMVLNVLSDVVSRIQSGRVTLEGRPPEFSFKR